MGHVTNHAILVTGCYGNFIKEAHARAVMIFPWVSPISPEAINGSRSFFVPPDGSKEGWKESEDGDNRRAEFLDFLRSLELSDGSSLLAWCELYYGGDDAIPKITDHSNL